jgi:hypothetical protein
MATGENNYGSDLNQNLCGMSADVRGISGAITDP